MLSLDVSVDFFEGLLTGAPVGEYWQTLERLLGIVVRKHPRVCFTGALALSAHGVVRSTSGIDLLVHPEERDRLVAEISSQFELREDLDTLLVFVDPKTGTEIDLLIAFDPISLAACTSPARATLRGHKVRVVDAENLAAMKVVAAVDSPAVEPKQRADLDALVRADVIEPNRVSRLLQDEAGVEYARYFMSVVRHVRAHPKKTAPRRRT